MLSPRKRSERAPASPQRVETSGECVWLPVEDKAAWVRATVERRNAGSVDLKRLDTNEIVNVSKDEFSKLSLASVQPGPVIDDLTQMGEVSYATMLDMLRRRYANDDIYTAIGPVIISVNPYKPVSGCTSEAIAKLCALRENAPPHVVRAATIAFTGLTESSHDERRAQSVLISGESGAGKTEACKLCLLALAELSKSSGTATDAALESAILLEAFGNARTVYNDNSSRFGKWCAVYFDHEHHIAACQAQVYLLEKTRIVSPPQGERNYHIFYQMLVGCSAEERTDYRLHPKLQDYQYFRHGTAEHTVDGVDDAEEWEATKTKFDMLGLERAQVTAMLRLVSATLALGNLSFSKKELPAGADRRSADDEWLTVANRDALELVCGLLELVPRELDQKLTTRTIDTGKGSSIYTVPVSAAGCADGRDALAKALYVGLFEWLVGELNELQKGSMALYSTDDEERFVGLLDIFGFENFAYNSFEQLCINFTNERLQAHFMDALVKLRIQEYESEGVDCEQIEFPDNEAQLTLLDHKSKGVFALLDDECNVPKGSDRAFVDNLIRTFQPSSVCFDKPKRAKGGANVGEKTGLPLPTHGRDLDQLSFVVVHYAESVMYTADKWLDKNRGYLNPEILSLLTQSDSALVTALFPRSAVDGAKKSTVSSTFRKSLKSLSTTMLTTSQTYLRCIKPNGIRKPDAYDGHFVLRQLRYTGVASVVTIQRSGYPISMTHGEFVARYRCIALTRPQLLQAKSAADVCRSLLAAGPSLAGIGDTSVDWIAAYTVQVGRTRVYLKDEVMRALEAPRLEATRTATLSIQRYARGMATRTVTSLVRKHNAGAAAVRAAMATLSVEGASAALDELNAMWGAYARVPMGLRLAGGDPMLPPAKEECVDLEREIEELESGLDAEAEAMEELRLALAAAASVGHKEAYVQLKVALQAAHTVSRGLRPELVAAVAAAEEALSACLGGLGLSPEAAKKALEALKRAHDMRASAVQNDDEGEDMDHEAEVAAAMAREAEAAAAKAAAAAKNAADAEKAKQMVEEARQAAELAAWEAEVLRQEAERERAHRAMVAEQAEELVRAAAETAPSVLIVKVILNNDFDVESSKATSRLKGYTPKSTGVTFSDVNHVASLRKGGLAAREGMLHVGDAVIAVDGKPLSGERVEHALNAKKKESYELTVARQIGLHGASTRERAALEGWLTFVKAKDGSAMALQWPRKLYVVLDASRAVYSLCLQDSRRATKAFREQPLKGAQVKTPVMRLRGQELKQPPVIAGLIAQLRFPFTISWPDGEVDHDMVFAATTSEDRSKWVKALNAHFKALKAAAPTSGWLLKQGGRGKEGLAKMLSRDRKRWFVLQQPEEGHDAIFRYYDAPPSSATTAARGAVVINHEAELVVEPSSKLPNAFRITSKGANDAAAITTVLAADSSSDLSRWMSGLHKAISGSGGSIAPMREFAKEVGANLRLQKMSSSVNEMMAMSKLDVDELLQLKVRQLQHLAKHLDAVFHPRVDKDKKKLVDLIVHQRNTHALHRATSSPGVAARPILRTWGSDVGMMELESTKGNRNKGSVAGEL